MVNFAECDVCVDVNKSVECKSTGLMA